MMKINIKRHLPMILSFLACGGVVGTTYLAIRNTKKAEEEIKVEQMYYSSLNDDSQIIDPDAYKRDIYMKNHISTFVSAVVTCICIIESNNLSRKYEAALISACSFVNENYRDYRNKVIEYHGIEEDERIINEIAAEDAKLVDIYSCGAFGTPSLSTSKLSENDEIQLFYDGFSRRYFKSTLARVLDAEYNLNRNYCLGAAIPLNEWYEFLGIEQTIEGNELGWYLGTEDDYMWLDFDHTQKHLDDGTPYIYINMELPPNTKWQEEW